jgi:glycosyltransferase 2 family protein
VYFMAVWIRAWRWHYLLKPVKSIRTGTMFPITCIGYMGNNIYPARAGEVLRAVVLKRREDVSISASLATIIVERIFDGVVMLAFVIFNLAQLASISKVVIPVGKWNVTIQDIAVWGSAAFFGALLVFLLAAMLPKLTARIGEWFIDRFLPIRIREQTIRILYRFLNGLESLRSPFNVLMVFITSVLIWLMETGKYWFVMHAFPFQVNFFTLMLINGVVNLTTTIPASPAYIGTFDLPAIAILMAVGIAQGVASAYTLVLHFALWFPITALGAWYMTREGIKWSDSLRAELKEPGIP